MKAAVLHGVGQMAVERRNEPSPGPGEVTVRVRAAGICGTDQHIYHGHPGSAAVTPPIVLGHELAGIVAALGEGVEGLKVGDRVSVDPNIYCGICRYCRDGRAHLCDRLAAVGVTRDGGMGELCVVPAANCYVVPDTVSFAEAALAEPLGCVLHGFRKLTIRPDYTVLIVGGGFIGQLFLQLAKASGARRIVVSEPDSGKYETLRKLGADETVNPLDAAAAAALASTADVVLECVGRPDSMTLAVEAAAKGAQVLLFGVAAPTTEIGIRPYDIFAKELRIFGSFINPYTHPDALALIDAGIVRVEPLVTHRFALDDMPAVMADYPRLKVGKGLIVYE
ncbi:alcohol dehydrogenase [Paenibacillus sp. 32O-W]|uniref:zinc-dependent alcohol dehydrogenase family protein n=1 Tax=Paenibacillus sp. 32O-W TaxID=1695218 RepID=UPI000722251E|nr:zinc-dependent alcohol dehydrogenase family protein [Paenibacillus sp. 32O-W]ALS29886.1 alcohol dehydrogenase [Paenibacillus sp. 32O-W]